MMALQASRTLSMQVLYLVATLPCNSLVRCPRLGLPQKRIGKGLHSISLTPRKPHLFDGVLVRRIQVERDLRSATKIRSSDLWMCDSEAWAAIRSQRSWRFLSGLKTFSKSISYTSQHRDLQVKAQSPVHRPKRMMPPSSHDQTIPNTTGTRGAWDPAYHDEYDVLIVEHPVTWTTQYFRVIRYRTGFLTASVGSLSL